MYLPNIDVGWYSYFKQENHHQPLFYTTLPLFNWWTSHRFFFFFWGVGKLTPMAGLWGRNCQISTLDACHPAPASSARTSPRTSELRFCLGTSTENHEFTIDLPTTTVEVNWKICHSNQWKQQGELIGVLKAWTAASPQKTKLIDQFWPIPFGNLTWQWTKNRNIYLSYLSKDNFSRYTWGILTSSCLTTRWHNYEQPSHTSFLLNW